MAEGYDVIVIGGGLGGLTAAGLVAQAGRKTLLIERNHDVGGAASIVARFPSARAVVMLGINGVAKPFVLSEGFAQAWNSEQGPRSLSQSVRRAVGRG